MAQQIVERRDRELDLNSNAYTNQSMNALHTPAEGYETHVSEGHRPVDYTPRQRSNLKTKQAMLSAQEANHGIGRDEGREGRATSSSFGAH